MTSVSPGSRKVCQLCRKPLSMHRNGAWYHIHNASEFCNPGDGTGRKALPISPGADWSDYRDHTAGGMTVAEALDASGHRADFDRQLARFVAKASRHESVRVMWWHAPYIYVEVLDSRQVYPGSMRALISFDITNGEFASPDSRRQYMFARRGWRTFLARLLRVHESYVPLYREVAGALHPVNMAPRYAQAALDGMPGGAS